MVTAPVLIHADLTKPFILTTDASRDSIGYVLSQIGLDGKEHPVAFSGRSLRNAERNWGDRQERISINWRCERVLSILIQ